MKNLKLSLAVYVTLFIHTSAALTIDLTQEGGSLEQFVTQDQDGIGVCYANTASAVLQGVLDDVNDISYFDLAIQYKESTYLDRLLDTALDEGYVCQTIYAAKQGEGVCTRENVLLENFTIEGDRQNVSRKLLEKTNGLYQSLGRLTPEKDPISSISLKTSMSEILIHHLICAEKFNQKERKTYPFIIHWLP